MKKSVKVVIMIAMILVSLAIAFICVLKITEKKKGQLTGDPMRAVYLEKDDGEGIFVNLEAKYPFTGRYQRMQFMMNQGRRWRQIIWITGMWWISTETE